MGFFLDSQGGERVDFDTFRSDFTLGREVVAWILKDVGFLSAC